jgi:hypothetical protein
VDDITIGTLSDGTVWYIGRGQYFYEGQGPPYAYTRESLLSKFGDKPRVHGDNGLEWLYNSRGDFVRHFHSVPNRDIPGIPAGPSIYESGCDVYSESFIPLLTKNGIPAVMPVLSTECYYAVSVQIDSDQSGAFLASYNLYMIDAMSKRVDVARNTSNNPRRNGSSR